MIANHTGVAIYLAQASTKDEKKHEIIDDNLGTIQHDEMKASTHKQCPPQPNFQGHF